jgi:archaellin
MAPTNELPKSGPGPVSVYAWVVVAAVILFVLIITALAIKTICGKRLAKRKQRVADGDAIFGPVIKNPVTTK